VGTQALADSQAVQAGQHPVEHDEVRLEARRLPERRAAVGGDSHVEAFVA
jgi:hypothetical protein